MAPACASHGPGRAAVRVFLGLGSNLGDRAALLEQAVTRLGDAGLAVRAVSRVYETEPQGRRDQGWFLNCVVLVETDLPPREVLEVGSGVERAMGRQRLVHWGPRVIDIDVLLCGGEQVCLPDLVVPHPRLHERAFALVPLCELDPDVVIPGRGPAAPLAALRQAEAGQGLRLWGALRSPGAEVAAPRSGVRAELLGRLQAAAGGPVSGGVLAAELGVSRSAVWKQVQRLRAEGHDIRGSTGTGYRLLPGSPDPGSLSGNELLSTERQLVGRVLHVLRRTDSTNRLARQMGLEGSPAGTAVIAEEQTAGRGRHGREFLSPPGGVYASVLLRPALPPAQAGRLTLLAAVAVCEALEGLGAIRPVIKWPNDILLPGGKVCGILLEMVAREDCADFVVLGMGVNVSACPPGVGATSLWAEGLRVSRGEVARALLDRLDTDYAALEAGRWGELLAGWRRRSATLGQAVRIRAVGDELITGRAVEVTSEGALLVDTGDGVRTVFAGDVTHLRPPDGADA